MDYERIISMEDQYSPNNFFSLLELSQWEESNLTEMIMANCNNRLFVGKIHYLKKEFQQVFTYPMTKPLDIKWSPQGKYLVLNEGNVKYLI